MLGLLAAVAPVAASMDSAHARSVEIMERGKKVIQVASEFFVITSMVTVFVVSTKSMLIMET
jgi:hypothetical protein